MTSTLAERPRAKPAAPPPQARRGAVGARLPGAAEQERGKQEVRRRAQRPPADHRHLRQGRFRLDRPGRPARPLPLVRAFLQRSSLHRRRQDRRTRAGRARRPLLHAPGPHRRRPAVERSSCGSISEISVKYARGTGRRHRAAEHPAALDRDRVGPGDLGGLWRPVGACPPPRPAATRPRVILGCPLAGPGLRRADRRRPRRSLPSPTSTSATRSCCPTCRGSLPPSISGCAAQGTHHEINDIAFAGPSRHPETGEVGYDPWVGGGLSTNPMIAKRLGAFVRAGAGARGLGGRRLGLP